MPDITPVLASSNRYRPMAELTARLFDLPTWRATVLHLDSVEASMLPALGEMFELLETAAWQSAQSDAERRQLIKTSHRRRSRWGTPAGLKQAAAEAGATIRKIWTPASKIFAAPSATPAERNAWLSQHPELRLYPRRLAGQREGMFAGDCIGRHFAARSSALVRSRLSATLVKAGVETELETASWELASLARQAVNEILIPGQRGKVSFVGGGPFRFVAKSDASTRMIVLRDLALYDEPTATLGLRTVAPGFEPIDADGEMVAEVRAASPGATFAGRFPRFAAGLEAELAQYRRIKLFDPSVPAVRARAACHVGYNRVSMPAHCADIELAIFGKQKPTIGRFAGQPCAMGDRAPLQRALASMRLAARESDSILIDTRIFKPVRMGHVRMGQAKMGGVTNQ